MCRDRAPWVGFAGNAYVLPAGAGASIPIVSVNTDKALGHDLPDRRPRPRLGDPRDNQFLSTSRGLESPSNIGERAGEMVWEGEILDPVGTQPDHHHRRADHRRRPRQCEPGVYVITARAATPIRTNGASSRRSGSSSPTSACTALSGSDGIHAIVRSLVDAPSRSPAPSSASSPSTTTCSARPPPTPNGYVRFDPGLARGTGGAAPQMIDATPADGDYAFIDLRALGLRPLRSRRRRPSGAWPARRLRHAGARHLPPRRDRPPHRAGPRRRAPAPSSTCRSPWWSSAPTASSISARRCPTAALGGYSADVR